MCACALHVYMVLREAGRGCQIFSACLFAVMWVMAREPWFSGRISSAFNWGTISPALSFLRKWVFFFFFVPRAHQFGKPSCPATPRHPSVFLLSTRGLIISAIKGLKKTQTPKAYVLELLKLGPCILWQALYEPSHISSPGWQIDSQKVHFICGFYSPYASLCPSTNLPRSLIGLYLMFECMSISTKRRISSSVLTVHLDPSPGQDGAQAEFNAPLSWCTEPGGCYGNRDGEDVEERMNRK